MLVLCSGCDRHVKSTAPSCPFCGATMAQTAQPMLLGRVSRAAMFASASAIAAACSAQPMYGACAPMDIVRLTSPCGFSSVTSTCEHATVACSSEQCTISPITANCTINAVLGDGTAEVVHVTVGPNTNSFCHDQIAVTAIDNGPSFTTLTCEPPPPHFGDATTD